MSSGLADGTNRPPASVRPIQAPEARAVTAKALPAQAKLADVRRRAASGNRRNREMMAMSEDGKAPQVAGSPSMLGKFGTVVFGLLLLLVGLAMLEPEEFVQTNMRVALAAAISAFGIGLIATVFLPHSIEVSGKRFQPLGLDVKASGGAAVFLVVLAFLYSSNQPGEASIKPPDQAAASDKSPTSKREDAGARDDLPDPGPVAESNPPVQAERAAPPPQPGQIPPPQPGPIADPFANPPPAVAGMVRARTYCSYCCNGNPIGCEQVGGGQAYGYQDAAAIAYDMCVRNEGAADYCRSNMQQF
jgi:hypothetical protein